MDNLTLDLYYFILHGSCFLIVIVGMIIVHLLVVAPHLVVQLNVHLGLLYLLPVVIELCLVLNPNQDGVSTVVTHLLKELQIILRVLVILHRRLPDGVSPRPRKLVAA